MVLDFGDIKAVMNTWVDDNLDHRMILCRHDPAVELLKKLDEPMYLLDDNPTAENIAKLIFDITAAKGFPGDRGAALGNAAVSTRSTQRDRVVCGSGIPVRHRLHEGNMGQGTAWRKRGRPGAGIEPRENAGMDGYREAGSVCARHPAYNIPVIGRLV